MRTLSLSSVSLLAVLLLNLVSHYRGSCVIGIFAVKAQRLFALKQAIIASRFGPQFVLLPQILPTPTIRPNTSIPATTRPTIPTTPRPVAAITLRPNAVIAIPQLFPGMQYLARPPGLFPPGFFPIGQQQGLQIGIGNPPGGMVLSGAVQPQLQFPGQIPGLIAGTG